jgi:hypothetical protein
MKLLKKYLKDERIDLEDGEVKLSMRPVTTSQQARLADLAVQPGVTGRIERTNWCLKNLIEKLEISGAAYTASQLLDGVDLSDEDTTAVYIKIGTMVVNAAFASADDKKKSPPPPEPGA